MDKVPGLSEALRGVVEYELGQGNNIVRIDTPAVSRCPFAVIFAKPLDFGGFQSSRGLPGGVKIWENYDRHYDIEAGYVCERTRHIVAGPISEP
jgi:hypothetical protein